jgi:DNA-binding MarR family transcriptional regulator
MKQTIPTLPELYQHWMRIWNKMNIMENIPRNFGLDNPLYLSEIHTLQAIGNSPKNNVRIIADLTGVTPSAASQVITKLAKRGLVRKIRGVRNEKEVLLELTPQGLIAYDNHEKIHAEIYHRIFKQIGTLNEEERATLGRVFSAFESVYNDRIRESGQETISGVEGGQLHND